MNAGFGSVIGGVLLGQVVNGYVLPAVLGADEPGFGLYDVADAALTVGWIVLLHKVVVK